jgi:hypothetical protein
VASTIALTLCGTKETGSPYAPSNATSHWLWGEHAIRCTEPSIRHTLAGYAIHHASSIWWACFYEKWFGERAERGETGTALAGGAAVTALAYVVDFRLTPQRLTPGFERHLSRPSLLAVYAAFGAGLMVRARRPAPPV